MLENPILWRGLERMLIVVAANFFAYLGFRLYVIGVENIQAEMGVSIPWMKFAMSGGGPGLLFMGFGGLVLIWALRSRASSETETTEETTDHR